MIQMEFCDLSCRHARWPEKDALDGSGSCRTFQAIYCEKKDRHVSKNMPCPEKSRRPTPEDPPPPGSG